MDGDICAYRCSAANEKAELSIAKWQVDQLLSRILQSVDATDWKVFITGGNNNFRTLIDPQYKANREKMVRPRHLEPVREHLILEWNAECCDGYEADDALGMAQDTSNISIGLEGWSPDKEQFPTVICSIDKDLLQIPGLHYNFVKNQFSSIDELGGWYNFYYQVLVGDATDNVKGCQTIGPVKATKALKNRNTIEELYKATADCYMEVYKDTWWSELNKNAQLLFIWRKPEQKWVPPLSLNYTKPETVSTPESSQKTTNGSTASTPPTTKSGTPVAGTLLGDTILSQLA